MKPILINFSHPLSPENESKIGDSVERIANVKIQIDLNGDIPAQIEEALESVPLTEREWQTLPLTVILPGLSVAAAVILASIHGRSGSFPDVLPVVPAQGPDRGFVLGPEISLQNVRSESRKKR